VLDRAPLHQTIGRGALARDTQAVVRQDQNHVQSKNKIAVRTTNPRHANSSNKSLSKTDQAIRRFTSFRVMAALVARLPGLNVIDAMRFNIRDVVARLEPSKGRSSDKPSCYAIQ
jgi:hypothetical protein